MIDWKVKFPADYIYFRPCTTESAKSNMEHVVPEEDMPDTLLFIYMSSGQKHLLQRYGSELCMLDATYKTTKYSLPLFFVAVKTNVGYSVVAAFVVQHETTYAITEALELIKSWNPQWSPRWWITDYCEAEINAIESVFQGI